MMHRDLKSPNVLLSEEGVAKIADVGMVRAQVKDLVTAQPIMTPLWAAPEVGPQTLPVAIKHTAIASTKPEAATHQTEEPCQSLCQLFVGKFLSQNE